MKRMTKMGATASLIAVAWLLGCTEDDTATTPSTTPDAAATDASTTADTSSTADGAAPADSAITDAPADTTSSCKPFTGAAPTVSAAPACHDLANAAPEIGTTVDPGTIPTGLGGTISDGLYYLTEVRLYAGSPIAPSYKFQQTYLMKDGKSYVIERTNTGASNDTKRKIKSPLADGGESTDCTSDVSHVDPPGSSMTATCDKVTVYVPQFAYAATLTRQP